MVSWLTSQFRARPKQQPKSVSRADHEPAYRSGELVIGTGSLRRSRTRRNLAHLPRRPVCNPKGPSFFIESIYSVSTSVLAFQLTSAEATLAAGYATLELNG